MINAETIRKLRQLDLDGFVDALEMQEMNISALQLTFDERIQLATDSLYQEKYNHRVQGLINRAKLRFSDADLATIYYEKRDINREILQELGR